MEDSLAEARRKLHEFYVDELGPRPAWSRPLHRFAWVCRAWIIGRAIGNDRLMHTEMALFKCMDCRALITNAGLVRHNGRCGNCGGGEFSSRIRHDTGFWGVAKALVQGR